MGMVIFIFFILAFQLFNPIRILTKRFIQILIQSDAHCGWAG